MWCGYGDADSTFVWPGGAHPQADAERIGQALVGHVNGWWREHLRTGYGLESSLELEFDTHYARLPMSTLRGSYEGGKKRHAGLVLGPVGGEQVAYKGLEAVRSDWSPLAQQLQQKFNLRIFKASILRTGLASPWRVRCAAIRTSCWFTASACAGRSTTTSATCRARVRGAHGRCFPYGAGQGKPAQYRKGGQVRYVMTTSGPETLKLRRSPVDYEYHLTKQLEPTADAILPFVGGSIARLASR